jgi:hypothetical protein
MLLRTVAILAFLAVPAASPAARAGDPAANPIRGSDLKTSLETAEALEKKDLPALVAALVGLAPARKESAAQDLDLAVEYAARETDRPLRFLALEAARTIDRKGAAERFRKKLGEKDVVRVALAVEALGHVGSADDVPALMELLKSPSEMVACAAATALARVASSKHVDEILDAGLVHPSAHVTDHCAWAVQDLVKKPKVVLEKCSRIAGKKSDPRAIRAEATAAMLEDDLSEPHKWGDTLAPARAALLAAPASVTIKGTSADGVKSVQAALDWIKANLPAQDLVVRASVKQINVPGTREVAGIDPVADAIDVPLTDAALEPRKIAYLLQRSAIVLFQKKIGEPWKGHRGWEPAIFDTYDLCVVAKLYDAGPAGLNRERFVQQILGNRPWGGM